MLAKTKLKKSRYTVFTALLMSLLLYQQCRQNNEISVDKDSYIEFELDGQLVRQEADFIDYDSLVHYPIASPVLNNDKVNIGYSYTIYSVRGGFSLTTYRPSIVLRIDYDSSLFYEDDLGTIKFKDANDFYSSFEIGNLNFLDLNNRIYPNASFYLEDTMNLEFTSHGEVTQTIDYKDETFGF